MEQIAMNNDLELCPFCGNQAEVKEHSFYNHRTLGFTDHTYSVKCSKCFAETYQFYNDKSEAIEVWNNRTDKLLTENNNLKTEIEKLKRDRDGWRNTAYHEAANAENLANKILEEFVKRLNDSLAIIPMTQLFGQEIRLIVSRRKWLVKSNVA